MRKASFFHQFSVKSTDLCPDTIDLLLNDIQVGHKVVSAKVSFLCSKMFECRQRNFRRAVVEHLYVQQVKSMDVSKPGMKKSFTGSHLIARDETCYDAERTLTHYIQLDLRTTVLISGRQRKV